NSFSRIAVRLETSDLTETVAFIKQAWHKHFPAALLEFSFMDKYLERQYRDEEFFANIFITFVILSLLIACLGLFGLSAFAAQQRIKEICVRKVLGASVSGVVTLLSKQFVKLVLLANLMAWPVAWFVMNRWLENFAYRIEISWWLFTLGGVAALVIALLTVSTQAIRAALANPVEALRYE
ncbi:ABC transporter permease, partial [bacterium]|nr:ABC transporter permease [bacterium]